MHAPFLCVICPCSIHTLAFMGPGTAALARGLGGKKRTTMLAMTSLPTPIKGNGATLRATALYTVFSGLSQAHSRCQAMQHGCCAHLPRHQLPGLQTINFRPVRSAHPIKVSTSKGTGAHR